MVVHFARIGRNTRPLSHSRRRNHSQQFTLQYHASALSPRLKEKQQREDHEFLFSVLSSSSTKRDARVFLSQFKAEKTDREGRRPGGTSGPGTDSAVEPVGHDGQTASQSTGKPAELAGVSRPMLPSGVNLGSLFVPPMAMSRSPKFWHDESGKAEASTETAISTKITDQTGQPQSQPRHLAVVKLRAPQLLNDHVLDGVCLTLVQLAKLGMNSTIVVDPEVVVGLEDDPSDPAESGFGQYRKLATRQAERLSLAIQTRGGRTMVLSDCFGVSQTDGTKVRVAHPNLVERCLFQGLISIVVPVGWTDATYKAVRIDGDVATLALLRHFGTVKRDDQGLQDRKWAVDRVILLDPAGGIPTSTDLSSSHVFVNMAQEYQSIRSSLAVDQNKNRFRGDSVGELEGGYMWSPEKGPFDVLKASSLNLPPGIPSFLSAERTGKHAAVSAQAQKNLDLVRDALLVLPASSSGLVITPHEVAVAAKNLAVHPASSVGVQTRRHKNPLIYNLLTDKSATSPSLPTSRLFGLRPNLPAGYGPGLDMWQTATFAKKGTSLNIIPSVGERGWAVPGPSGTSLDLRKDPNVDLDKLVYLINDSFGRSLDVDRYLDRIQHKIAGLIIAGDYEGGAILTWETPDDPSFRFWDGKSSDEANRDAPLDPFGSRIPPVPYLDKFAVLKKSQGTGGVADIVFNAMSRTCFPTGVVWRSRQTNPVNKWYFERAVCTWRVPDDIWTAFWTGQFEESTLASATRRPSRDLNAAVVEPYWRVRTANERFGDYLRVCRGIRPTWLD